MKHLIEDAAEMVTNMVGVLTCRGRIGKWYTNQDNFGIIEMQLDEVRSYYPSLSFDVVEVNGNVPALVVRINAKGTNDFSQMKSVKVRNLSWNLGE